MRPGASKLRRELFRPVPADSPVQGADRNYCRNLRSADLSKSPPAQGRGSKLLTNIYDYMRVAPRPQRRAVVLWR
jgi:hypothetical protein